ncbi:MAG: hypothetical protein EBV86_18185 [Marivivens sp.]|nr:hypothetical protein [Marivivens sp.]
MPEQLLHVESASSPTIYIKSASATAGTSAQLEFANGTDATSVKSRIKSYRVSAADARSALALETTNTSGTTSEALRIDSSQRVGIGTPSPAVACDVVGQVRASTGILFGSDTAAANALDDWANT